MNTSIRLPRERRLRWGIQAVSSSWQRSAKKHGLDPLDSKAPRILTSAELKHFREPLDKRISSSPAPKRS
jgi:transcriptional regulator of acetoin/glycerol metabolism